MLVVAGLTVLLGVAWRRRGRRRPPPPAGLRRRVSRPRHVGRHVRSARPGTIRPPPSRDMASHGVRTLYIETANYHNPASTPACSSRRLRPASSRSATRARCKVVAWYLPGFKDPQGQGQGLQAQHDGHRLPHLRRPEVRLVRPRHRGQSRQAGEHAQRPPQDSLGEDPQGRGQGLSAGRHHPVAGRHEDQLELLAELPLQGRRRRSTT